MIMTNQTFSRLVFGAMQITLALFLMICGASAALAQNRAYISLIGGSAVAVIDTTTNTIVAKVPVGTQPGGLAVTPDGAFVYVGNRASDNVSVINTSTNTVIATVPVGKRPIGVAITPNGAFPYRNESKQQQRFSDKHSNQTP